MDDGPLYPDYYRPSRSADRYRSGGSGDSYRPGGSAHNYGPGESSRDGRDNHEKRRPSKTQQSTVIEAQRLLDRARAWAKVEWNCSALDEACSEFVKAPFGCVHDDGIRLVSCLQEQSRKIREFAQNPRATSDAQSTLQKLSEFAADGAWWALGEWKADESTPGADKRYCLDSKSIWDPESEYWNYLCEESEKQARWTAEQRLEQSTDAIIRLLAEIERSCETDVKMLSEQSRV